MSKDEEKKKGRLGMTVSGSQSVEKAYSDLAKENDMLRMESRLYAERAEHWCRLATDYKIRLNTIQKVMKTKAEECKLLDTIQMIISDV